MERDDETSGSGNSYTTTFRQYDPRLGRWKSLDPLKAEFPWQSPYVGMDNSPILLSDPFGDSTWVNSRKLNLPGGGVGVHTYVVTRPDGDPSVEDGGEGYTTYSFFEDEDGNLTGEKNWDTDKNWDPDNLKGRDLINVPEGMTDEEFRGEIDNQFNKFREGSFDYSAIPSDCSSQGNCNTSTTTLLNNSGVPLDEIKSINPPGFNPGLGKTNPWGKRQQLKEQEEKNKKKLEKSRSILGPKL